MSACRLQLLPRTIPIYPNKQTPFVHVPFPGMYLSHFLSTGIPQGRSHKRRRDISLERIWKVPRSVRSGSPDRLMQGLWEIHSPIPRSIGKTRAYRYYSKHSRYYRWLVGEYYCLLIVHVENIEKTMVFFKISSDRNDVLFGYSPFLKYSTCHF
jgi:hypothetical protein